MPLDYIGDELPEGYEPWRCSVCTAVCNFEAMTMCPYGRHGPVSRQLLCPHDRERPESNGGAFGFMVRRAESRPCTLAAGDTMCMCPQCRQVRAMRALENPHA